MFMHDAAACAIGIVTMLPMIRAVGIEPHSRTAKFMMLSVPFACSCGGLGTLIGGGRCMVAAAALILPIVIPMAQLEGINPVVLALCLGMATSFAMLLVIGCPPNAIAYNYRFFKSSDLTKAGAVATPVLLGILVLVAAVWWKILGVV
jgi:di/tricarboxylate transporter